MDLSPPPAFLLSHLAAARTPDALPKGRGGVGRGLGTPRFPGLHLRRPPSPHLRGREMRGWGSHFLFRGCVTGGAGGGVKVRSQVCGQGAAARGSAIFGDFGAARETASQAALSPPAAGPESPAGRGAEVTDWGRQARSSPYLVKEAVDWPAEQKGAVAGRPRRLRGSGEWGWPSLPIPPPALRASRRPRSSVPCPALTVGDVGACGPRGQVVADSGEDAEVDAWWGRRGEVPPGKHHRKPE